MMTQEKRSHVCPINTELQQELQDGKIPTEIKGAKYVSFAFELGGTEKFTKNNQNITGGFQAPIFSRFVDGGLRAPRNDDRMKKELYKYVLESGFGSTKPDGKLSRRLDEMTSGTLYVSAPSLQDDFEACLISSLNLAMFFILDDNFDKKREDSDEFILSDKAIFQISNMFVSIYERNPIEDEALEQLSSEVKCPTMFEILKCIITQAKMVQNLLESKSSICSDEKAMRHYIDSSRYFMAQYAWHHRYLLAEENISDDMLFELRACSLGLRNAIEIWALSKDVYVGEHIRHDPVFHRVYKAAETICSIMNDIFSFSKEMSLGEYDNIMIYKCRQGITLEKAFEVVQQRIAQEYRDYANLSEKLRQMYSSDTDLQNFADILDYFVTYTIPFSSQMPRYNQTKYFINGEMIPPVDFD